MTPTMLTESYPPCDIFVAWRDWHLCEKAPVGARVFLWEQDQPTGAHFGPEARALVESGKVKLILGNEYHRRLYGVTPEQAFVVSNGIDVAQFNQSAMRLSGKCIYMSHPHRGLKGLREYWPRIREAVPHATLHAFWWQKEFFMPPDESIGVMPMRSLGHMELAREILSSDLFTYPSVFSPEIGGIVCLKAQAGGAWPVVVLQGGMGDYLQYGTPTSHERFAERVIDTLTNPIPESTRQEMMDASRERYSWTSIASKWCSEFEGQIGNV
jgi:glycosyltransferase involved in cell wall biosynthesis